MGIRKYKGGYSRPYISDYYKPKKSFYSRMKDKIKNKYSDMKVTLDMKMHPEKYEEAILFVNDVMRQRKKAERINKEIRKTRNRKFRGMGKRRTSKIGRRSSRRSSIKTRRKFFKRRRRRSSKR